MWRAPRGRHRGLGVCVEGWQGARGATPWRSDILGWLFLPAGQPGEGEGEGGSRQRSWGSSQEDVVLRDQGTNPLEDLGRADSWLVWCLGWGDLWC